MMKGSMKWAIWLFCLVASFAVMEGWSLHDNTSTLSRFVWTVTYYFPPTPFVAGFLAGFLCCHFWWGGIVSFASVKPIGNSEEKS
jgi:hypothetical protein